MHEAMLEAAKAATVGEVPVGAVVVDKNGVITGRGYNSCIRLNDPTAHAEIIALREAGKRQNNYRLGGSVLIVTLEPCLMCAGALVHARLAGVVYGASDVKAGAVTSCLDGLDQYFHNHSVWHCGGILQNECSQLLTDFFRNNA